MTLGPTSASFPYTHMIWHMHYHTCLQLCEVQTQQEEKQIDMLAVMDVVVRSQA
jgi:hypothetical protein